MKYLEHYDFNSAKQLLIQENLYDWATSIFDTPSITIKKGCTTDIRDHLRNKLLEKGWSSEISVDPAFDLTIFSIGNKYGFQIQTGNITRAFYDLIKLEHLYKRDKIKCGILAVPSLHASKKISSNVANFTRIMNELNLFRTVFTLPLLLINFE